MSVTEPQAPRSRTNAKGDGEGHHQAAHPIIVEGGNERPTTDQVLIRAADRIGDRLVQVRGGLLEGFGIAAEAENSNMADTGHDPAKGADGGKRSSLPTPPT